MIRTVNSICNFTNKGRHKANAKVKARLEGWPTFIKDDKKREEYMREKMGGRRYDERGMEVR
jgi:hypothetical protein